MAHAGGRRAMERLRLVGRHRLADGFLDRLQIGDLLRIAE